MNYFGDALFFQAMAQHYAGRDVRNVYAGRFRKEGHRAGRPRVYLDDRNLVAHRNKLDVEQTHNTNAQAELYRVILDGFFYLVADAEGRVNAD